MISRSFGISALLLAQTSPREDGNAGGPPACCAVHKYDPVAGKTVIGKAFEKARDGDAQFETS